MSNELSHFQYPNLGWLGSTFFFTTDNVLPGSERQARACLDLSLQWAFLAQRRK